MAKFYQELPQTLEERVKLPVIEKTDVSTLKLKDAITSGLPPIAQVGSDPLSGYSTKAIDAAKKALETGIAFGVTKSQLKRNLEVSKAEEKQTEKYFRQLERDNKKRLGNYSRAYVRNNDAYTRRFAGEMLGMDRNLFKVIR